MIKASRASSIGDFVVLAAVFLSLLLASSVAEAQSTLTTTASNNSVAADVWNGSGWIDFYIPANPKERLSFPQHSYLTVEVGNVIYTNNSVLQSNAQPTPTYVQLTSGTFALHKDKSGLKNDTIRTIWQISNSFQIIQDVYPVVFPLSGSAQIVYKISVNNLQNSGLNAQAQYLLDNEISSNSPPFTNDGDTLASRFGYAPNWTTFSKFSPPGIPPFELAFEHGLCSGAGFPGIIGVGFTNDSLAPEPMGLMSPETYTFVDWITVAPGWTWGFPTPSIGFPISDAATLIQWPASGTGSVGSPNAQQEIACGSYGVQQCGTCQGQLAALLFHPEHIVWTANGYVPEHFPVEAIVFDPNSGNTLQSATGTQTTQGAVRISSPQPTTNTDHSQVHSLNPSSVQACELGDIIWEDWADSSLINCSTSDTFNIQLTVNGGGVGQPFFFQSCICPIEVDCQEKDLKAPRFTPTKTGVNGGLDTASFGVFDDSSTDLGMQSIAFSVDPPGSASCVGVTVDKITTPCSKDTFYVHAKQLDSTCATCVYVTATDCALNVSYDTICFSAHAVPGHPDLPPIFWLQKRYNWNMAADTLVDTSVICNAQSSDWNVTDSIIGDAGLISLKVLAQNNMTISDPTVTKGSKIKSFTISVTDRFLPGSITIQAIDDSNHVTDTTLTYCTVADKTAPRLDAGNPIPGVRWTPVATDSNTQLWDRGIDSVIVTDIINCFPKQVVGSSFTTDTLVPLIPGPGSLSLKPIPSCGPILNFEMDVVDSFQRACWTGQVVDCAGNSNTPLTTCMAPDSDTFCPIYEITNLVNPPGIQVIVYDIHAPGGDTVHYDLGVKTITFCADSESDITLKHHNLISTTINNSLPPINEDSIGTVGAHIQYPAIDTFYLYVTDTTIQGLNSACVCFSVMDGANNVTCQPSPVTWCYPLAHDTHAPAISVVPVGCLSLQVVVTDSLLNDQGIYSVKMDSVQFIATGLGSNFKPSIADTLGTNPPAFGVSLQRIDSTKSAYAQLSALDLYGKQGSAADRKIHTDSTNVWIYSQDLSMSANKVDSLTGPDTVNVYLIPTDSIPLAQKQISEYQFTFHLAGSNRLAFLGTTTLGTWSGAPLNWTVTPLVAGASPNRYYTITGMGNPVLPNAAVSTTKPLVKLIFQATPDTASVESTDIIIDTDQCLAAVIYNNGNDTTISGPSYSVTLPAPTGRLNGGRVILKGLCTPLLTQGAKPDIISIAPTIPNPTANSTLVIYTIPADAPVSLDLYNALGEKVRTLVSENEKQGNYRIQLDASGLPEGSYFLRLASGGQVVSRQISLSH